MRLRYLFRPEILCNAGPLVFSGISIFNSSSYPVLLRRQKTNKKKKTCRTGELLWLGSQEQIYSQGHMQPSVPSSGHFA